MIFERGDRFIVKQKEDSRPFIALPSVLVNAKGIKIVDDWRQTPTSTSPVISKNYQGNYQNATPGPLSYDTYRSTLSTKGGTLSQAPKFNELGNNNQGKSKLISPGPGEYYHIPSLVTPSYNVLIQPVNDTTNHATSKRHIQTHRKLRSVSLSAPVETDAANSTPSNPIIRHLESFKVNPKTSSVEERRQLRSSLRNMLHPLSPNKPAVTEEENAYFVTNPVGELRHDEKRKRSHSSNLDRDASSDYSKGLDHVPVSRPPTSSSSSNRLTLADCDTSANTTSLPVISSPCNISVRTSSLPSPSNCQPIPPISTTSPPSQSPQLRHRTNSFRKFTFQEVCLEKTEAAAAAEEDFEIVLQTPPTTPLEPLSPVSLGYRTHAVLHFLEDTSMTWQESGVKLIPFKTDDIDNTNKSNNCHDDLNVQNTAEHHLHNTIDNHPDYTQSPSSSSSTASSLCLAPPCTPRSTTPVATSDCHVASGFESSASDEDLRSYLVRQDARDSLRVISSAKLKEQATQDAMQEIVHATVWSGMTKAVAECVALKGAS